MSSITPEHPWGMQLTAEELRRFDRELLRYFMRRTGSPELAEDLRQEVWLAARHYRGEGPPKNFLRAVAHRQLVNHLRQKHRHPAPLPADISSPQPSPEHRALQRQSHRVLHTALAVVPEPFRQTLRLHLAGKSHREIAVLLTCSEHTVRSRLFRGRQILRRALVCSQ